MDKLVGRKVKLFFDDGTKISWRQGFVTSQSIFLIELDNRDTIPLNRIIRIESMDGGLDG